MCKKYFDLIHIALQASDDDFKTVKRNGNHYFQSRHLVQFWKCKYLENWRCVDEGMMMAVFSIEGHFLNNESIKVTKNKENVLCPLSSQSEC